ncbi:Cache 3/Cache 2 fusion domain-containing protein [Thiovibrio sp. JS02]
MRVVGKPMMKPVLVLITLGLMLAGAMQAAAETEFSPKIKTAMAAMKEDAAKLGTPTSDGSSLFFGANRMNENYELVDSLKARFGGTATFFVKKGDAFVRISTNVMKDGKRAIGTPLDPSGPAIAAIRQDKAYYGIVDILGKLYDTGYEPIKNAGGEIIGVYYIGFPLE